MRGGEKARENERASVRERGRMKTQKELRDKQELLFEVVWCAVRIVMLRDDIFSSRASADGEGLRKREIESEGFIVRERHACWPAPVSCLMCKLMKLSADAIYPLMRATHLYKHTHTHTFTHRNAGVETQVYTNMTSISKYIKTS